MIDTIELKDLCINDIDSILELDEEDMLDLEDLLIEIECMGWLDKYREISDFYI